jgi:catalase
MSERKKPTTRDGASAVDNQSTMTAGLCGPASLQDVRQLEKRAHFDREGIPQARMHVKGSGANGSFTVTRTVTRNVTRCTRAKILSAIGSKTDLFLRFSTVDGERGAADALGIPRAEVPK